MSIPEAVLLIATLLTNGFTCSTEKGVVLPSKAAVVAIVCEDKNTGRWEMIATVNGKIISVRSGYRI
jgi:hypothetical protein